jgi:hypothetical protein
MINITIILLMLKKNLPFFQDDGFLTSRRDNPIVSIKDEFIHFNPNKKYYKTNTITDSQGLTRAYQEGDIYHHGKTLYVAGTHTIEDTWNDIRHVPFYGDLRTTNRFKKADEYLQAHPEINRVVGHSLGSSIILELQKKYPHLQSTGYGGPTWDPMGLDKLPYEQWVALGKPTNLGFSKEEIEKLKVDRHRNLTDPISIFDGSAQNNIKWNPFTSTSLTHSFDNIGAKRINEEVEEIKPIEQYPDEESKVLTE